jgi:hypothetical protein
VIEDYFKEHFHVANIFRLYEDEATRHNIISGFRKDLIENDDIKYGDAIVFFFAGHGGRIRAPEHWETDDAKIETICPVDQDIKSTLGIPVPGIPDITMHVLLRELAEEKGPNIVSGRSVGYVIAHYLNVIPPRLPSSIAVIPAVSAAQLALSVSGLPMLRLLSDSLMMTFTPSTTPKH